jgi:hypothetical protein
MAEIEKILGHQSARIHDLRLTIALVDRLCKKHHSDDFSDLESDALGYARRHTVERIYRLIRAILVDHMPKYESEFKSPRTKEFLHNITEINESEWHAIISRSITYASNFDEFVHRFAWVGQMDYSFLFFQKIAERAMKLYDKGDSCQGGWFYRNNSKELGEEYLSAINAKNFSENFSSILIQIIHHLVFREKEFDRLINFEFRDAAERLTKEKIDRIISAEGPHRAKRATQLALEGIYFFK